MATLFRESRPKIQHKANVYAVYVDPAARKHGVGRALMLELIAQAKAAPGLEQLTLTVTSNNAPAKGSTNPLDSSATAQSQGR